MYLEQRNDLVSHDRQQREMKERPEKKKDVD